MKIIGKMIYIVILSSFMFSLVDVNAQRGCCSWHKGVRGCENGRVVCNDGTFSPSCTCGGSSTDNTNNTPAVIYGCTDSNSINYNPNANKNDGSCIKKILGCTNQDAYNYNSNANTDDGSCIAKVYGCIDNKADNYNKEANITDSSCIYTKTKTEYKKIKYKTKYKYKFFAKEGKVLQKGKNGKKKIEKKIIINEQGEELDSKIISTEIINKATPKIIVTKDKNKTN